MHQRDQLKQQQQQHIKYHKNKERKKKDKKRKRNLQKLFWKNHGSAKRPKNRNE